MGVLAAGRAALLSERRDFGARKAFRRWRLMGVLAAGQAAAFGSDAQPLIAATQGLLHSGSVQELCYDLERRRIVGCGGGSVDRPCKQRGEGGQLGKDGAAAAGSCGAAVGGFASLSMAIAYREMYPGRSFAGKPKEALTAVERVASSSAMTGESRRVLSSMPSRVRLRCRRLLCRGCKPHEFISVRMHTSQTDLALLRNAQKRHRPCGIFSLSCVLEQCRGSYMHMHLLVLYHLIFATPRRVIG